MEECGKNVDWEKEDQIKNALGAIYGGKQYTMCISACETVVIDELIHRWS